MSSPILRVDIEKRLGDFGLSVRMEVGPQVLVLFGPSGAGKTTILNAIAGLLRPEAGEIALDGRAFFRRGRSGPLVDLPPRERQVGYVFQQYLLFPHLTVGGNVAYGLPDPKGPATRARVAELLQRFHLDGMEERRTWQLSGGQQQRVALARALASEPRVLLLDEPFGALDLELRRSLRREVRRVLKDSRVPVLFVTHDTEEALALADTVLVMDRGRVVASGDPLAVLGQPAQERVARLVGVENLLRLTVAALHPVDGVMVCAAGAVRLEVPLADATPGEEVVIGVRAADIILASQEPRGLSARNLLRGIVTGVEPRLPGFQVALDCGFPASPAGPPQRLLCHVTRGALEELAIRPGATLWAVIKASVCHVLQDGASGA